MRKNKKIVLSVVSIVATVVAMFSLVLTLLKHENPNTSSVQNAEVFVEDSKNTSEQQVTIEIADTTFSGSGTHIKIKNNETYNVTNCTFVGATDSAIILEGGTLNLSGSKFEDCAGFEGGAIYSESAGTLNITNSTFENCDATENGGSIGSHGANITIDKSTFQNCGADCGGAIYAMGSGAIDIRSTMFVSNDAISGGAIYTDLEKFTIDKDLTDDEDCTQILNCSAADGGGLFLFPTTVLCMYDGVFAGNTASGSGGSVYVDCGTIIMYGGAIWGNGVDADDDGIIDSNNNDEPFTNAVSGGAVYVSNGTMSMYGGVIEGNVASDLDKSLSSNDYHGGGGICLLNSDFTMTGGSVVGNTIHEYGRATKRHGGGGIAAFSSSVTISGTTTKIEDNNAFGYFAYTTATTYGGGGIYTYLGDFTMTGGSVKDNESKILGEIAGTGSGQHIRAYGGGIYCGSKTATISGVTIENNESHNRGGGLFFVDSGSSIFNVLGNSSVINNKSVSNAGGGIAGGGGTMNIGSQNDVENSVIIEGNYSRFIGAGVFLSGTRLNMYSGKIIGNSADQQGGGIGVTSNAIMNLYGGEISENKAASGGGIFINVVDQSKISKVENVTLSGNVSVNGNGHEISVTTASLQLSNVEINSKENGTFENLDYGKNYSVIHNSGGVLSILDDSSIKNEISGCKNLLYATNSASVNLRNCDEIWHFGSGYAFSLSNGCNFEIDGGDSKKAYVDHNGNGFIEFVDGNNLKVNNYMISNCKVSAILASCIVDEDNTNGIVELSNIEIKDGTGTNGGAIYLNNVDKCYLTNGKISDCSSTNGGAVYALNSKLEIDAVVTTCTADYGAGIYATGSEMLISDTISNCQATYGGGLYCTNTSVILAGTISGCKATFEGGAISSYSGTIDISGQILDCDLSLDDGNVKGGAMYVYKGSLAINGTGCVLDDTSTHTISGCDSSGYGGAIFLDDVDDVDLNSGVISNCTSGSGGAVFSRSSDIGFEEDYGYFVVSNCVATVNGGAFCLEDYSTLELSDKATVDGCSATTNGGAVYAKSSDVFLSGGISGCVASNLGGGIFVNSGTLKMTTGEISGCTANHGAGIYATSLTTIEIGCQILDCVATHYGGGMFVESSTLNLSGMINNCSSGSHGGGIHIKYGTLDASNATISACSAETSYGGGIYSQYSNISAIGAELLNCNATRGGGIYAISNSGNGVKDIDLDAVTISNCDCNVDGGRGGGIFANFVNINVDAGSKISGCDATENGGGLFAESTIKDSDGKTLPCKVVLSGEGTEVSGCVAQQGGGVFVSKSSFEMNAGVCLLNNIGKTTVTKDDAGNVLSTREGYGGGLYLGDLGFGNFSNCSAYIYGGLIQGNEATRGAGIYVVSAKVSMGTDENTPTTVLITKNITDTAGGGICVRGTSVVDYYGMNFGDNLRNNNYGIVDNIIRYKADSSRSWVGRGAGVYLLGDYAFFNMYNGNISGNIIDGDTVNNDTGAEQMPSVNAQGAAMFVTANSGFVMKGGIVSGNIIETCESNYRISAGGVMSIYSGGYAILDGAILEGVATEDSAISIRNGGAIMNYGRLEIKNGTIIKNFSAQFGGAIANYYFAEEENEGINVLPSKFDSLGLDVELPELGVTLKDVTIQNCWAENSQYGDSILNGAELHLGANVTLDGTISIGVSDNKYVYEEVEYTDVDPIHGTIEVIEALTRNYKLAACSLDHMPYWHFSGVDPYDSAGGESYNEEPFIVYYLETTNPIIMSDYGVSNFSYIDPYGPADTDYYYYKKIDGTSTYGLTQFLDVTIGYYDENENFQTDVYNDVYYLSSSVSGYELNISFLQKDNDAFTTVLYDGQGMCPEWNFKYHENTLRIYASVHFATVTIENGDGLIDFSERFYAENNAEAVRVYVDDNAGTVSVDGKVYMASEVDGASFLGWSVSGSVSNYDQSNLCYVLYTEDAITITPLYEDVAMITVLDYQGNEAVQICDMRTIGVTMSNASMSVAFDELTGVDDYYVNRKIDVDDTPYYFVYWAYKLDSEEWVECVEFTDLEISIESKIVIKPVYEIGKISLTIADLLDKTIYDEDQIVLEFNSNQITIVNGSETTSIIDPVANFTYWEISYNYGVSYESVESGTQITIKRGDVIILRAVYMTNW